MKKWIAAGLAVLLTLQIGACALPDGFGNEDPDITSSAPPRDKVRVGNKIMAIQSLGFDPAVGRTYTQVEPAEPWTGEFSFQEQLGGYASMDRPELKQCYEQMAQAVYQIGDELTDDEDYPVVTITVPSVRLPEYEVRKVMTAFLNDHPEVFWVKNIFRYAHNGNSTLVELYSHLSPEECRQEILRLDQAADAILQAMPAGLSEYERELYLHDYLVDHCTYDHEAAQTYERWQAFNALGALGDESAVCEGYSRAMQLLLSRVGMECRLVGGASRDELHMWNAVRVDGEWYHLDATWNDSDDRKRYDYFNLDDEMLQEDHTIDPDYLTFTQEQLEGNTAETLAQYNLSVPACTAMEQNYYWKNAVYLPNLEDEGAEALTQALRQAAQAGEPKLYLRLDEGIDYDTAITRLFVEEPFLFSASAGSATGDLPEGQRINVTECIYSQVAAQRVIDLALTYQ